MSDYIVGLTGGIGSGKSTVADEFARLGADLVDADVIARDAVKPGSKCLKAIVEKFGVGILLGDYTLDRPQLRILTFSNLENRQWLNRLLHPAIRSEMLWQLHAAESAYCILVAPLLFENKLERFISTSLVVDVPIETQIARTCNRDNVDESQVKSIIAAQIERDERLAKADDVIDNNLPWTQVKQQIPILHAKFMAFSKNPT